MKPAAFLKKPGTAFPARVYPGRVSIFLRTVILAWGVITITLGVFAASTIVYQKQVHLKYLDSKARALATSIAAITSSAFIGGDYSVAVDHCLRIISENPSIRYLVATRQDGYSLVHLRGGWRQEQLADLWLPAPGGEDRGKITDSGLAGEKVFHFSYQLSHSGIDWGWIHVGLSLYEFQSYMREFYLRMAYLLLFCVCLCFVLAFYFARQMSRPLLRLKEAVRQFGEGDLSTRVKILSGDEVEDLAESFNQMADALQRSEAEQKAAFSGLQAAQAQLVQSEKLASVGQLAAGVAHEINNPLAVILGFSQGMLSRVEENDPLRLPVASIAREAVRCRDLVRNLLLFSRAQHGERKEAVSLSSALGSALALIEAQAKTRAVELVKELDGEPLLHANNLQIQQILINLASNSIDAMPNGGTLTISGSLSAKKPGMAEIRVKDTGCGIKKEVRNKIFEPFFTTKEVGKGTGLGLSLVYEIVRKHNGEIEVESEEGNGTTVSVFLPVQPP